MRTVFRVPPLALRGARINKEPPLATAGDLDPQTFGSQSVIEERVRRVWGNDPATAVGNKRLRETLRLRQDSAPVVPSESEQSSHHRSSRCGRPARRGHLWRKNQGEEISRDVVSRSADRIKNIRLNEN